MSLALPRPALWAIRQCMGSLQALVSEVKAQLAQASSTPANLQRLVFRGRVLKDEQRLSQYSARCTRHLIASPTRQSLYSPCKPQSVIPG